MLHRGADGSRPLFLWRGSCRDSRPSPGGCFVSVAYLGGQSCDTYGPRVAVDGRNERSVLEARIHRRNNARAGVAATRVRWQEWGNPSSSPRAQSSCPSMGVPGTRYSAQGGCPKSRRRLCLNKTEANWVRKRRGNSSLCRWGLAVNGLMGAWPQPRACASNGFISRQGVRRLRPTKNPTSWSGFVSTEPLAQSAR